MRSTFPVLFVLSPFLTTLHHPTPNPSHFSSQLESNKIEATTTKKSFLFHLALEVLAPLVL
jgi:hypothetical protein